MKLFLIKLFLFLTTFSVYLFAFESDSLKAQFEYNQNGLHLISALINDRDFFEEWQKPKMPILKPVDTYRLGEEVIPVFIFAFSAKDENGNANLTYDINILKPDGTVYGHFENLEIWKDASDTLMHLVKQPIIIRLESSDPLGVYKINITVSDNVQQLKVQVNLSFQVIENCVLSQDEMRYQLSYYYLKPNSLLLPALIRSIDESGILEKESTHSPIIGFITTALASSLSDSQVFKETISSLSNNKILFSFCYSLSSTKDTIINWSKHAPSVNDLLWGAFFASGDKRVVERLVSEMQFCDEKDSLQLFLTGASAKWSLSSNAKQHPLVRKYLEELVGKVPEKLEGHLYEALNVEPSALRQNMINGIHKFKK
jgi:hypothetical protein